MTGHIATLLMVVLSHIFAVDCYHTGAPAGVCDTMTPDSSGHGASPQNTAAPYTITVSPANLTMPGEITVTIMGNSNTNTMQGIMVQARAEGSTNTVGTFSALPAKLKYLACAGGTTQGAVTHNDWMGNIPTLTLKWTPSQPGMYKIWFTVVNVKATFWVQQKSDTIYYTMPEITTMDSNMTMMTSMSTMPTTPTGSGSAMITASLGSIMIMIALMVFV